MIKLYTLTNCLYCKELKEILLIENISYIEINIDLPENEIEYIQIYKISQCEDVPIIRVNNNLLLPNISFKTINEAVELIKKFIRDEND